MNPNMESNGGLISVCLGPPRCTGGRLSCPWCAIIDPFGADPLSALREAARLKS
jgi:hypothetical protein